MAICLMVFNQCELMFNEKVGHELQKLFVSEQCFVVCNNYLRNRKLGENESLKIFIMFFVVSLARGSASTHLLN